MFKLIGLLCLLILLGLFVGFNGVLGFLIQIIFLGVLLYAVFWLVILGGIVALFKWIMKED